MIQEIGHNIIYPSDTSHERNSRGDFTIPLEFSSFRKRFAKFLPSPISRGDDSPREIGSAPPRPRKQWLPDRWSARACLGDRRRSSVSRLRNARPINDSAVFSARIYPPPRLDRHCPRCIRTWDEREHAWRMIYYYWDEGGTKGDGRERGGNYVASIEFYFRFPWNVDLFRNEFYLVLGKNWFNFIPSRLLTVRNIFSSSKFPATLIETRKIEIMESLRSCGSVCIKILFSRNWMWKGLTRKKRSHDKSRKWRKVL